MPPDTVIPALASLLGDVTGVAVAYDQLPGKLNAVDLPAFVLIPQEAEYVAGNGFTVETREYALLLYVKPLALDTFGQAHTDCRPFFDRVRAAFVGAMTLSGAVDLADLYQDSGVIVLVYAAVDYVGIEFRLRVRESYCETFAP